MARAQWADIFVAHCLKIGLDAIAVTDHHDACFVDYVSEAISRVVDGHRRLWFLPGMEITCRDAVQCLVLFDRGTSFDTMRRLFGGHLNIAEPDRNDAANPHTIECGKQIEEFITSVASDPTVSPVSIILPNASSRNGSGHKTILRSGFHPRFASLQFDGVYIDHAYAELDEAARRKIYGKVAEWGTRRRGVLPTGDNRNQDFARLGSRDCWIRLGEPTVESVRQALLADEARIAYERPALPAQRILELRVDSTLTGPDFTMSMNDGFTAIIGGRRSGKSAILEYLRFALGRSASDVVPGEKEYQERDQQLIAQTLAHGSVTVKLERDGVVETWTRSGTQRDTIAVEVEGGAGLSLNVHEAQQRFRARAFYQKQLSSIVLDRDRTAEQITGIAAAELSDQRRQLEREIAAAKRDVGTSYQRIVEFWVAEGEHRTSAAAVTDLKARLEAISGKMGEAGLSEAHQDLLRSAPDYALVSTLMSEARTQLTQDRAMLGQITERLTSLKVEQWQPLIALFPQLSGVIEQTSAAKIRISEAFSSAVGAIDTLEAERETAFVVIAESVAAFQTHHAEAVTLQESGKALVKEAQRLSDNLQTALSGERRSAARLEVLSAATNELKAARVALDAKLHEFAVLLDKAVATVMEMSGGSLRASVTRENAPKQHHEALCSICESSRIRDLQSKCEERVAQIAAGTANHSWSSLVDAVLDVRRYRLQTNAPNIEANDRIGQLIAGGLFGQLTPQQLNSVFNRIDDATTVRLLTATADRFISFEYRDAGGYIPFGQASPGQQASALLKLLLAQQAGTLIIDQPEDDLDNRVIMEIAKLLQQTKRKRQLMFATHNPNIVVNGDADKIVVLTSGAAGSAAGDGIAPRIDIAIDGAIETPAVRQAVTETMEGGQAAFELRSRKYSFATA